MSIANGYGPDWTTEGGRVVELQRRVVELEQQLAVARAEAQERSAHVTVELQRRVVELEQQLAVAQAEAQVLRERSAHVDRCATRLAVEKDTLAQALARARELAAKWRAAPQDPGEPLLAMAADELEAALSKPAEQHDPLAVSDHCSECGEPEPECACDERIEDYRESGQEGKE